MRSIHTARALALATAAATLFAMAPLAVADGASAAATDLGYCYGVNACKGKSSCKTAKSACQGHNACKGQGFVDSVSAETCAQLGGQFKTEDPMKKG